MADDRKNTFPYIASSHWWAMRLKFRRDIKTPITSSYLETVLGINKRAAEVLIKLLRDAGIIDAQGKLQELGKRWREDETYKEACDEIKKRLYPQELLDGIPNPNQEKEAAVRWFSRNTDVESNATVQRMVTFYQLLNLDGPPAEQDLDKIIVPRQRPKSQPISSQQIGNRRSDTKVGVGTASQSSKENSSTPQLEQTIMSVPKGFNPSVHIDIQVHLASDVSLDQIDKIFESMAKHLYKRD